jgi:hypothetical protein
MPSIVLEVWLKCLAALGPEFKLQFCQKTKLAIASPVLFFLYFPQYFVHVRPLKNVT